MTIQKLLITELPDYRIRVSQRAKRMQLKVSPLGTVEVVIPYGHNPNKIPAFVSEHRAWINKTLARMKQHHWTQPELKQLLPVQIKLLAVDKMWTVEYDIDAAQRNLSVKKTNDMRLRVNAKDEVTSREVLRRWFIVEAKFHLLPWLRQVSHDVDLHFTKATVRGQKTRWGSCTARKNISLNRNLLFLPSQVVRYLFIHELCHTVYLNHSKKYWALVETLEPDYRSLDAELRKADRYVPLWIHPDYS